MATQPVDEKIKRSAEQAQEAAEQTQEAAESTEAAAEHTQAAARTTAKATVQLKDSADRTYAAWVRTGLASLASGIGAKKLLDGVVPDWMIISTGSMLVFFSAFCFAAAVWRQIFQGAGDPEPDVRRIPPFLFVIFNGFLALVALAALISIGFGRTGGD